MTGPFHLRKWYFDCISANGDAAIIYLARVRWRSAVLHYASVLLHTGGPVATRTSLRRFRRFDDSASCIDLVLPGLDLTASFRSLQPSLDRTVHDGVHWTCLQPKSETTLKFGDIALHGLGYAERLELTIPPWKLPLSELHWGRFLSPDDSLIWIDWRGQHQSTIVIHNGQDVQPEYISAAEVRFRPNSSLGLDQRHNLRTGRLADTVAPYASVLSRFFPRSLFGIRESKWCSSATFTTPDHGSKGWAIHEVVEWPY